MGVNNRYMSQRYNNQFMTLSLPLPDQLETVLLSFAFFPLAGKGIEKMKLKLVKPVLS